MRISGVLILYNPTSEIITNIDQYIHALDHLYIIDNSDKSGIDCRALLHRFGDHIDYFHMGDNKGLATALNTGCHLAIKENAQWVLTMDQDSLYDENGINLQINALKKISSSELAKVGILSCNHFIEGYPVPTASQNIDEVDFVMTSGNLINLAVYSKVGGFREDLFIDEVDVDFCKRIKIMNFKILISSDSILHHFLGNTRKHRFLFYSVMCSHHSYVRRYYITRNRLYMIRLYPDLRWSYHLRNLVSFLKVIVLEEDKLRKIRAFIDGIRDSTINKYGKKDFNY